MNSLSSLTKNVSLPPAVPEFPSMIATGVNAVGNTVADAANVIAQGTVQAANGVADSIVGAANNAAKVATNVIENVPFGNTLLNISNSLKNSAKNIGSNTLSSLPGAIASPINQSISAVPEPESLWITLPLIIGIGALIIAFILIVKFRDQINATLQNGWNSIKSFFAGPIDTSDDSGSDATSQQDMSSSQKIVETILPGRKEVFNVADNHYTFADAEPLCKALGAELATYDQVKEAWNSGADWCNYGWVKGQAAIYPTQQETFDKLQNEGTEDARLQCGQVGINGGYFDNPELRFGVNCYGVKPPESKNSASHIMKNDGQPRTPEVIAFDQKVANYKAESGETVVNPFKPGAWSS
jgi:hypothetical protein